MIRKDLSRRLIAVILLLVLCAGLILIIVLPEHQPINNPALDATSQYYFENPMPRPRFINWIRATNESEKSLLCFSVWQGAFWSKGDDSDLLQSHLITDSTLTINDRLIVGMGISIPAVFPRDENGNITEDFGGNIEFCYESFLPEGVYTAAFKASSLEGTQNSYSWGFRVNADGKIDLGKLESTPSAP